MMQRPMLYTRYADCRSVDAFYLIGAFVPVPFVPQAVTTEVSCKAGFPNTLFAGGELMKDISSILKSKGCKQFQRLGLLAVCFTVLALSVATQTALAQTTVSTIEGTIKDAKESVVAGA